VIHALRYAATHDRGRPINPMMVEGKVHGGIAQSLGAALSEEQVYDDTLTRRAEQHRRRAAIVLPWLH